MAKKDPLPQLMRELLRGARNSDTLFHIFTGKKFKDLAVKAAELYGEDLLHKLEAKFFPPDSDEDKILSQVTDPYKVLGVRPDAYDFVVKSAFRELVRQYHPDVGRQKDAIKFQKVVECYNAIMQSRQEERERRQ